MMPRPAPWSSAAIAVVTRMLREGKRPADVAPLVGKTSSAIRQYAKRLGLVNYSTRVAAIRTKRAAEMRRAGKTLVDISTELRATTTTVRRLLIAQGFTVSRRRCDAAAPPRRRACSCTRYDSERSDAVVSDWPEATQRQRRYLELLEICGPLTIAEIAAKLQYHPRAVGIRCQRLRQMEYLVATKRGHVLCYDLHPAVRAARRTYLRLRGCAGGTR